MERVLKLKDKTALVTGASRGIGRSIALELAREGADIAVNCSASVNAAAGVVRDIEGIGRHAAAFQADVADKAAVERMIAEVVRKFGKIDILVNNAGMATVSPSEELEENIWRRGIDVMLSGTFYCCQAAGREMIRRQSGKIINIASINGIVAFPERASYCSAKAGVMALTRVLAVEWARYGINVNAIAPGYVDTELVRNLESRGTLDVNELVNRTPGKKLTGTADIGKAAVFFASEDAGNINGQTLVIDGGWTAYGYLESWLKR
jgi:NAD(P)-dependent dehydrogenase (short-subunit alcohol dehydrogenase family)